mgnify:CR=1 FL=1
MDKINQLLQQYFGITVNEVDSAEGRAALGNFYNRVQEAIATQDPTIIEFIIEEIQVAQGQAGGDGLVNENEVQNIVDESLQQAFTEIAETNPEAARILKSVVTRGYYVYDPEIGGLKQIAVPSAFPQGFEQLYNLTLQPELVAGLQNDLIKNGVVKEDYFDDEDEFGAKTTEVLSAVLEYADKNIFIDKTSEEGQKLIEQYGQGHYGFLQNQSDDIIFARAILDLAITSLGDDVRKQEEIQAKLEDEQAMQSIAARYTVPTDIEMEESVSEFISQYVPREATQKELDRYSTSLAEKYSDRFKQLLALEKAVRTNEIFESVDKTIDFEGREATVPEKQLRTSIFQISDPELEVQSEIKEDLEKEMSVIEKANAARQQQAALIQAMLGQL